MHLKETLLLLILSSFLLAESLPNAVSIEREAGETPVEGDNDTSQPVDQSIQHSNNTRPRRIREIDTTVEEIKNTIEHIPIVGNVGPILQELKEVPFIGTVISIFNPGK